MQTRFIEIACDESGFSGSNLLDPETEVFAHASVELTVELARECVATVQAESRYSATEYKSNQLLRKQQRPLLEWLLGATGPLDGKAQVHLTDKPFFLVNRLVELFLGDFSYASMTSLDQDSESKGLALTLHRHAAATFGSDRWRALLQTFIVMLRTKRQRELDTSADAFFHSLDRLQSTDAPAEITEIVQLLRQARPRVTSLPTRIQDYWAVFPPLEPLIPAVIEAALHWGDASRSVVIVHDEQSALTANRVAQINNLLTTRTAAVDRPLTVRRVDSRTDPRIQVADFLAGAARRIATAELQGQGDPTLTELIRPYITPNSIWPENAPWSCRTPTQF